MKVTAIKIGLYNGRVYEPGETFELKEKVGKRLDEKTGKLVAHTFSTESQFSDQWMEKLGDNKASEQSVVGISKKQKQQPSIAQSNVAKSERSNLEVI